MGLDAFWQFSQPQVFGNRFADGPWTLESPRSVRMRASLEAFITTRSATRARVCILVAVAASTLGMDLRNSDAGLSAISRTLEYPAVISCELRFRSVETK